MVNPSDSATTVANVALAYLKTEEPAWFAALGPFVNVIRRAIEGAVTRVEIAAPGVDIVDERTNGGAVVVDERRPRCPDCDDSGLTDHDPAMTPCASCGGK